MSVYPNWTQKLRLMLIDIAKQEGIAIKQIEIKWVIGQSMSEAAPRVIDISSIDFDGMLVNCDALRDRA